MWSWDNGHMDGVWGVVLMLGMMTSWVGLIALLVIAMVWRTRSTDASTRAPADMGSGDQDLGPVSTATASAEQILADRLARGEIDTDDYRARLGALTSRSQP